MADLIQDDNDSTGISADDYDDIYLGVLSVNGGTLNLSKSKIVYTCDVESDTTEAIIRAMPEYPNVSVSINWADATYANNYKVTVSLNDGRNLISLEIKDTQGNDRKYSLYINRGKVSSNKIATSTAKTVIQTGSQIALYPLDGGSYEGDDTVVLPITPSELMFDEDSSPEVIKLINYGEVPVSMNKKLASWSISSFFPHRTSSKFKYWFDISKGIEDPYLYYCAKLLNWKNNQTPLVFMFQDFQEWGYYNCQIKKFSYGRQDTVGNVYYKIDFQEYKKHTITSSSTTATSDYSSDIYYPTEGETILEVAKKLYGSSEYYIYFMTLNNLNIPEVKAGTGYKVR